LIGTERPIDNDNRATAMSTVMCSVEALLLATLPELRNGTQTVCDTLLPTSVPTLARR
jgi:hypothetical protein